MKFNSFLELHNKVDDMSKMVFNVLSSEEDFPQLFLDDLFSLIGDYTDYFYDFYLD